MEPREFLIDLFDTALAAVDPVRIMPRHLPEPPPGRTVVVAAGKAAAAMARAVEDHWSGPLSGLAVTRYGHGVKCDRIEVIEAGHPYPDDVGQVAAGRAIELVSRLSADDLALFLISGGGSALLTCPAPGISLADKQSVTRALLACGATISEINCVRKHLSAIKGGRLAEVASPARIATLVISDVPGDDPATVASGPTLADPTTLAEARDVLAKYGIAPPPAIARHLAEPANETPKDLPASDVRVIARAADALKAAADRAASLGIQAVILGDDLEGEARDLAADHAGLARRSAPSVLLSGGETTVTVGAAGGRGGRNAEYALALALALDGDPRIHAIACDTDGIDGTEDNAGAVIGPDTLVRARALGVDPRAMLDAHDAYGLFAALDDLVVTGPTRTNVNDFRAILIATGASQRIDL
jgi:hydroxypyruvate reductase